VTGLFIVVGSVFAADLTVGNNTSERPYLDSYHNFTIIDTNHPATVNGNLKTFSYYASNKNPFRFVVVDELGVVKWVSSKITPAVIGINTFISNPVRVQKNWNVGLYFESTGTVPYEYNGAVSYWTPNNSGLPKVGDTIHPESEFGPSDTKRTYSFIATGTMVCTTIKGGTILDTAKGLISLGYDKWGYNYQANMFNGWYGNYSRPSTPVSGGDQLMMKWNNAWLSNQDCDGDGKLDRHLGYPTYKDSGAWLTNHASGTYISTNPSNYHWNLVGNYIISFVLGGTYNHNMTITETGGVLGGSGGYPAGSSSYSYYWTINSVDVTGDTIHIIWTYDGGPDATGIVTDMTGFIDSNGSMSGEWHDNYLGVYREGKWSTYTGAAVKVQNTCTWSDFVKIVAVPSTAVLDDEDINWTMGRSIIGPAIWGEFAIIQEVSSDPCEEFDLTNYKSGLRSGLGNW